MGSIDLLKNIVKDGSKTVALKKPYNSAIGRLEGCWQWNDAKMACMWSPRRVEFDGTVQSSIWAEFLHEEESKKKKEKWLQCCWLCGMEMGKKMGCFGFL